MLCRYSGTSASFCCIGLTGLDGFNRAVTEIFLLLLTGGVIKLAFSKNDAAS